MGSTLALYPGGGCPEPTSNREIARSSDQSSTVSAQLRERLKLRLQDEMAECAMNASTKDRIPYAK